MSPVTGTTRLRTDRVRLRRLSMADVGRLTELDADPRVTFYITGGTPEFTEEMLRHWLADYERWPGLGVWAAEEAATGEFIGWFHLRPDDGDPARLELGYRLRRSSWGQGYATEGSRALIDAAFAELGATRVVAYTMAVHGASRRVMEKAGLRFMRTFRADWPYSIPGDEHGDVEYAISREDWERARA